MSSRLRSLDSKISFFAFADIITAVSGVLIFVALLLATDLGKPTTDSSSADSERERQLQETLAQQLEVDAQNRRLQELLTTAETSPNSEKLQTDIAQLRAELAAEQKKQALVASQMSDSEAALLARDKALGFDSVKNNIRHVRQETAILKAMEAETRTEMKIVDQQMALMEAHLLKIQEWEGQIWLIPDQSLTSKEPIVVFVDGTGATVQRVDHPKASEHWEGGTADTAFEAYLDKADKLHQYVVFEVKPSGIALFRDLSNSARAKSFDVGYDALEENKIPHLSALPSWDEAPGAATTDAATANDTNTTGITAMHNGASSPPTSSSTATSTSTATAASVPPTAAQTNATTTPPATTTSQPPPPKPKSWWERLLEWLGLR